MREIALHIVPATVLTILVQLFIHESGHAIGGALTGWKLIYLHIFKTILHHENGHYRIKKVDTVSVQCIMYPKTINSNPKLYVIMGCYVNLFTAFLGLIAIILIRNNLVVFIYAWSFFIFGWMFFLINRVPSTKRICNDGACYKHLKNDNITAISHNTQLLAAKLLHEGYSYGHIKQELICQQSAKVDNDELAYQSVLEYYHWLDLYEYDLAKAALNGINQQGDISPYMRDIITLEYLYLSLIDCMKAPNVIQMDGLLYNENLLQFVEQRGIKGDVHTERVKAVTRAYENLIIGKRSEAIHILTISEDKIEGIKCIYPGEKTFCIEQIRLLLVYLKEIS